MEVMDLLLDTHVALWAITDDPELPEKAREAILSSRNIVWVSAVTVWEITIKYSLGKKHMPISGKQALQYFRQAGYRFLAIEPEHAASVQNLPNHHQDPFDRLLVAQALTEPLRLMTRNAMISRYNKTIILI